MVDAEDHLVGRAWLDPLLLPVVPEDLGDPDGGIEDQQ